LKCAAKRTKENRHLGEVGGILQDGEDMGETYRKHWEPYRKNIDQMEKQRQDREIYGIFMDFHGFS